MIVQLITGTRRGWPRPEEVRACVRRADILIVGDAWGVDSLAFEEAQRCLVPCLRFVAHWERFPHGAAGPERNGRMVKRLLRYRQQDARILCDAFPDDASRGTWDCVAKLKKEDFQVTIHRR